MTTEDQLMDWTKPSSDTEQDKQERTERMVQEAIADHQAFDGCDISVYAKGSYPNNTNVRTESDVDIAVQCSEVFYYDLLDPSIPKPGPPYTGIWTPEYLRAETEEALSAKFGSQIDTNGNVAIKVSSSSARVDADVVPCFDLRDYFLSGGYREGTRIFRKSGSSVDNYPTQHLEKGRSKNADTSHYYKKTVRILKRTANAMEDEGFHRATASFLVESLVYNCPKSLFFPSTWVETVRGIIYHIWENTQGDTEPTKNERWMEANDVKYLFASKQSWTRKDARDFADAAFGYLELSE